MPLYGLIFVFLTMANISLPGTSSFPGEFLIMIGIYQNNTIVTFFATTTMVLGGAYALWLCNRLVYGTLKPHFISTFSDVNRREFFTFLPFILSILWIGIYPEPFLNTMHCSCVNLLYQGF